LQEGRRIPTFDPELAKLLISSRPTPAQRHMLGALVGEPVGAFPARDLAKTA